MADAPEALHSGNWTMSETQGAIDCDVHPTITGTRVLAPYLDGFWRDSLAERGIDSLDSISYPVDAPLTARADWRDATGTAAQSVEQLSGQVLDRWGHRTAILNCLYGVQLVFNEDMGVAFTRAVNDWIAREWLDRDSRLRASIVVPMQNIEHAVDEIDRCAADPRFVQILLLASGEMPLGRRACWPIYAAAQRHGLPIGIHAGSAYRHPVTSIGWPSYYIEDYASQSQAFQSQVGSLICEGVFAKFPDLKVVLLESGVTWLPSFLWRLSKFWRGLRTEVPWVDRSPMEIVRDHIRLTVQPLDAPDDPSVVRRIIDHMRSDDMLLYASDYPHWHFDGDRTLPPGIPADLLQKIQVENPLATYQRL